MKKVIIGITGSIASGKSEVRNELVSLGCLGIDADEISHQVLLADQPVYQIVLNHFGNSILSDVQPGTLDRKKIAQIVFQDQEAMEWLESVTHPAIVTEIQTRIHSTEKSVALEAIKLMESNLSLLCDERWLVTADDRIRIQRLVENRGMSEVEAHARIEAQKSMQWNPADFDWVFDGSKSLEELHKETQIRWLKIQNSCHESTGNIGSL